MNKIAKELAKEAKRKGICEHWYKELKTLEDKRAMVAMYVKGIDFCLSHDYPSNDYIRNNFKGVMEDYGVFLDDKVKVVNISKVIALGCTSGNIDVSRYNTCEVFAKNNSVLNVTTSGNAFVMIDAFDSSKLNITANGESKICINIYGDKAKISVDHRDSSSRVKIVHKNTKTYE